MASVEAAPVSSETNSSDKEKSDAANQPPAQAPEQQKKPHKHRKEDFSMGQLLGGGAFAKVVEATVILPESPQYQQKYAVKIMDKKHIMKNDKIKYVTIEKRVFLATESHPFICHLHFTFQDAFMHSVGIYHRDIKPENVLLHHDGHIRLTDFGTAKIVESKKEKNETENDDENATNGRPRNTSFVGTAQYVAPELLDKDSEVSYPALDFWSVGILMFECLCNTTPFKAPNEYLTFKKIEEHNYSIPDTVSEAAQAMINGFLTKDFESRLGTKGFDEIKNHEFFSSIDSWYDFMGMTHDIECGNPCTLQIVIVPMFREWDDLKAIPVPKYPETPKESPIHDEEKRNARELRGSILDGDDGLDNQGVSEQKEESTTWNQELYSKWNKFLNQNEEIAMGSTVERNKFMGISTEKSVMLLTAQRVLLIDTEKMALRKNGNIPRSQVVSCTVVDKESFELRFVKNKIKFKCSGPKAEQWKAAFDQSQ